MILDIDIGNTRVKWRLSSERGEVVATGAVVHNRDLIGVDLLSELPRVSRVRIVSVVEPVRVQLSEQCKRQWGITPEIARVVDGCGGVRCGYENPERLGVDRWLGTVAAWDRHRDACLVVSAGSALTMDVVDSVGVHKGGYILPGLRMMADALGSKTWGINVDVPVAPTLLPGKTTSEAVMHGCLVALVGAVERVAASGRTGKLFVTGGDAALVQQSLSIHSDVEVVPGLVLDGLSVALP
ncbi:MAG: type III pantothenate kinase [Porticoccaceae bacterium]